MADSKAFAAKKPPNILFIAMDDLRPQLGCYGDTNMITPNIDRLAREGVLFQYAYCQQAVCAPSRASLLTGLRPDSTHIFDLAHPVDQTIPNALTLSGFFKQHGYITMALSKVFHHHEDDSGSSWSVPGWYPQNKWLTRGYYKFNLADEAPCGDGNPDPFNPECKLTTGGKYAGKGTAWQFLNLPDSAYADGQTAAKAVAELKSLKHGGKPFFLAVGFLKPHLPFIAPRKYWDMYPADKIHLPKQTRWPKESPPLARMNFAELRAYTNIPKKGKLDEKTVNNLIRGYYACTTFADAMVGKVLDELNASGLRTNTIIVLWGDNGWKLDDYGAWCKQTAFEIDDRVPLIISTPDLKTRGQDCHSLVEFVDIFPTLAQLCHLPVPDQCQGNSLLPLLADPAKDWGIPAFSQYPRLHDHRKVMGYSLRSGQWRYTEWLDEKTHQLVARELYNHEHGPIAGVNLANEPEYASIVNKLSALLDQGQGWKKFHHPQSKKASNNAKVLP